MRNVLLSQSGEAFTIGFLADAIRDALHRYKKREKLTPGNKNSLKKAMAFLDKIYKGYLLALPKNKVEELGQQMPSYNTEYAVAFNYAIKAWTALELPLTAEAIRERINSYYSTLKEIQEDAECKRQLDENKLLELQRFFSKISELTLRQVEQQAIWAPFLRTLELRGSNGPLLLHR